MIKILFNQDGSIKFTSLLTWIVQGSSYNESDSEAELDSLKICVAVEGIDITSVGAVCSMHFLRPDGVSSSLLLEAPEDPTETIEIDGKEYTYLYTYLTLAQTYASGVLFASLSMSYAGGSSLFTYQCKLMVNPSAFDVYDNETLISEAQYQQVVNYFSNYYTKSETDTLLNGKVGTTSSAYKLYGTDDAGEQNNLSYSPNVENGYIVQRDSNGQVLVPQTPTANEHATSKVYVDNYSYSKSQTDALLATKQNVLTAGAGITITNNTISATTIIGLQYYASFDLLPAVGATNIIYMVAPASTETHNNYDEYIWDTTNQRYERIGSVSTDVDLSGYLPTYSYDSSKWDTTPISGSTKPVTSGGVRSALENKTVYRCIVSFESQDSYIDTSNVFVEFIVNSSDMNEYKQMYEEEIIAFLTAHPHSGIIKGHIYIYHEEPSEYITPCDLVVRNGKLAFQFINSQGVDYLNLDSVSALQIYGQGVAIN